MNHDTRPTCYGESHGYLWINWDEWLGDALLGQVSSENERVAAINADDHTTDPIGMARFLVPREDGGRPSDTYLAELGDEFHRRVRDRRYGDAIETFRQINDYLAFAGFPEYMKYETADTGTTEDKE